MSLQEKLAPVRLKPAKVYDNRHNFAVVIRQR